MVLNSEQRLRRLIMGGLDEAAAKAVAEITPLPIAQDFALVNITGTAASLPVTDSGLNSTPMTQVLLDQLAEPLNVDPDFTVASDGMSFRPAGDMLMVLSRGSLLFHSPGLAGNLEAIFAIAPLPFDPDAIWPVGVFSSPTGPMNINGGFGTLDLSPVQAGQFFWLSRDTDYAVFLGFSSDNSGDLTKHVTMNLGESLVQWQKVLRIGS